MMETFYRHLEAAWDILGCPDAHLWACLTDWPQKGWLLEGRLWGCFGGHLGSYSCRLVGVGSRLGTAVGASWGRLGGVVGASWARPTGFSRCLGATFGFPSRIIKNVGFIAGK